MKRDKKIPASEKLAITLMEMADMLTISRGTAEKLVKREDFYPVFRIGAKYMINVRLLHQWMDEQCGKRICQNWRGPKDRPPERLDIR